MSLLFASTLFVSAALLMMIQPLCARLVLPSLGGTPNVWNTCMLFFQTGLLAGYGYAHGAARWFSGGCMVLVHVVLLVLGFALLPIHLDPPQAPPEFPLPWLLGALGSGVALPYVVIAASGPLLQRWFALGDFGNPYFLYAASNAGSFAGLLAYPFVVEPNWTLQEQSELWRWAYIVLAGLTAACGAALWRSRQTLAAVAQAPDSAPPTTWRQRLHWLLLALVPSSLLLSVTNYLTSDIAAIPLLWVLPLALYLLTFTLVFTTRPLIPHTVVVRWQPLAVLVLILLLGREATEPLLAVLALHLIGFFWLALMCHGELARTKPAPARLTEFYFWLALGGALGGACNTLIAPLLFSGYAEYPLMLALAAALKPSADESAMSRGDWLAAAALGGLTAGLIGLSRLSNFDGSLHVTMVYLVPLVICYTLQNRRWRFGLAVAAVLLATLLDSGIHGPSAWRTRSFFGVHRVTVHDGMRRLVHGNTVHGQQFLDAARRREPLSYFHRTGPMGMLLQGLHGDPRLDRVGLVGLGAGSLAAYAEPGQHWTFFEIDPAVVQIAENPKFFSFLRDARDRATIDIRVGDARLTLQQSAEKFGVLVIDAFGSDAIPWHLLTREALELYRARLQPGGILAFHISNRYVDLEPVLANHAQAWGWYCGVVEDLNRPDVAQNPGKMGSIWLFLAAERPSLDSVVLRWRRGNPDPSQRVWTDDYANLFAVIRWRGTR